MPYQLVPAVEESLAVPLDKAVILFGRHPDCDVVITSSRKVSRKHCCVAQINDAFVVRDLGSMNGVRVNGKAVKQSAKLGLGDELIVGDVVFHLKEAAANGKKKAPPRPQATKPPAAKTPTPRHMISQDMPVIIPEEDRSFVVEESVVKSPTDSEIPIELSDGDIIDDSDLDIEIVE
jgi:pSer/pThr/pTyr-binding forkhead associated (FHA) protein